MLRCPARVLSRCIAVPRLARLVRKLRRPLWLIDAAASYLIELGTDDWFVRTQQRVTGSAVLLVLEDGNGHVREQQQSPYTDFPMPEQTLYACWDSQRWVIMLPSEY
jgi:hypothetical protein